MKITIKSLSCASIWVCLNTLSNPAQAENKADGSFKPSLIPAKAQDCLVLLKQFGKFRDVQALTIKDLERGDGRPNINGSGYLRYTLKSPDGGEFAVDAMTGDLEYHSTTESLTPQKDIERATWRVKHSLSSQNLMQTAQGAVDNLYPQPRVLNGVKTLTAGPWVDDGKGGSYLANTDKSSYRFFQQEVGVEYLNHCRFDLQRDTGELLSFSSSFRSLVVPDNPRLDQKKAVALCQWYLTNGKPVSISVVQPSCFTNLQREMYNTKYASSKTPESLLKWAEDPWFHQRLEWTLEFNVGSVTVDAYTGELVENDAYTPVSSETRNSPFLALFEQFAPITYQRPTISNEPTLVDTATVTFNGEDLKFSHALHYPPIIRDDSALIYDFYVKQFMINEFRSGKTVALRGLLKKGKRAELQIGSTKAKLNGKTITLETAPVVVNERLYLPAELLQLVNGIPIRWEPTKKTLWVETRYLRRDLPAEATKTKKLSSSSSKSATSVSSKNAKNTSQKTVVAKP